MLFSIAWRNLWRNRRRTLTTASAVAGAVILLGWLVGFTYGAYDQLIDREVRVGLGHLQIMPEGYLDQPEPAKVISDGENALVPALAAIVGVQGVSAQVQTEGLLNRDGEVTPVDLVGVDPERERTVSVVPDRIIRGDLAVRWCREEMADALEVLGGDEGLFGRVHGWPLEWIGLDPDALEALQDMSVSGVNYDSTFYAHMPIAGAVLVVAGIYVMFLLTGLWAALIVQRLNPVEAMREH